MSSFTYPMSVISGGLAPIPITVSTVANGLPVGNVGDFVILLSDSYPTGLYTMTVEGWQILLRQNDLCAAAIFGGHLVIYMNTASPVTVPSGVLLYKNGNPQTAGTNITPGNDIWITSTMASGGSGGGFANPMTALGDIIVGAEGGNPARLGKGSNGQVLTVAAGTLGWTDGFSNPMTTDGDMIVSVDFGQPQRLPLGTAGQVLTVSSTGTGFPTWTTPSGGGSSPITTVGDLIVGDGSGTPVRLPRGTSGQVLGMLDGFNPGWTTPGGSDGPIALLDDIFNGYLLVPKAGQTYLVGSVTSYGFQLPAVDVVVNWVPFSYPTRFLTMPNGNGQTEWYIDVDSVGTINISSNIDSPAGTFPQVPNTLRLFHAQTDNTGAGVAVFEPLNPLGGHDLMVKHTSLSLNDFDSNGNLFSTFNISSSATVQGTYGKTSNVYLTVPQGKDPAHVMAAYSSDQGNTSGAPIVGKLTFGCQIVGTSVGLGASTPLTIGNNGWILPPDQPNIQLNAAQAGSYIDVQYLVATDSPIFGVSLIPSSSFPVTIKNNTTVLGTLYAGDSGLVANTGGVWSVFKAGGFPATAVQVTQGDPSASFTGNVFFVDRTLGNSFVLNVDRSPASIQYVDTKPINLGDRIEFVAVATSNLTDPGTITWNGDVDRFYWDAINAQSPTVTVAAGSPVSWSGEYRGVNWGSGPSYRGIFKYGEQKPVKFVTAGTALSIPGMTMDPSAYVNIRRLDNGRIVIDGHIKGTITDFSVAGRLQISGFLPATVPLDLRSVPSQNLMGLSGGAYRGTVHQATNIIYSNTLVSGASSPLYMSVNTATIGGNPADVINMVADISQTPDTGGNTAITYAVPLDFTGYDPANGNTQGAVMEFYFRIDMEVETLSHT